MAEVVGFLGLGEWKGAIDAMVGRVSAATRVAVVKAASELERRAKEHSTGRPGPNVVTGSHRRGIMTEPVRPWRVGGWMTRVGPTMSYSRRLELGFTGDDSLGRHYQQPPFPYFRPAWDETPFERIFAERWREAL